MASSNLTERLAFFALVLVIMPAPVAADSRLVIGSGEWLPYTSETDRHGGLLNHIVTEAAASAGIESDVVFLPWARALDMAADGELDATCCWFANAERRDTFLLSEPLYEVDYVFFHLRDFSFDWHELEELETIPIGAIHQYYYGETFSRLEQAGRLQVERVPSDEINFRKLLAGRILLYPMATAEAGLALLEAHFSPEERARITWHPRGFMDDREIHLLLSRTRPDAAALLDRFNSGLKALRDNGRYHELVTEMQGSRP